MFRLNSMILSFSSWMRAWRSGWSLGWVASHSLSSRMDFSSSIQSGATLFSRRMRLTSHDPSLA